MPGASPLVDDLDVVRRLEDAGAPAIVMRSLFQEQLAPGTVTALTSSVLPRPHDYALAPDRYLEQVRRIKAAVRVPVIASLNGTTAEGWLQYAYAIQDAGADALELNVYHVAMDPRETGADVERRLLDVVSTVTQRVTMPVAVKLSPFYSSLAHLALQLERAGARGLVLFNRFYQPDIEPDMLEAVPRLHWSTSGDLLLRVRWLAILSGQVRGSLAATGGVHSAGDVVKAVMAAPTRSRWRPASSSTAPGSSRSSARNSPDGWSSASELLGQLRGSLSLRRCSDPAAFERGSYLRTLQTWRT